VSVFVEWRTQNVVEIKNGFKEIIRSEEIDRRDSGQQRQNPAKRLRTSRLHEAFGIPKRAERLRCRITSSRSNAAALMFLQHAVADGPGSKDQGQIGKKLPARMIFFVKPAAAMATTDTTL